MRSERKAEIKSVSFPQDRDRYRMEGSWHTIMGDKNKKDSELEAYHEKTQRWMELLNILVEEQNFQTVAELAEQVAVSSRTIHSDLQDTSFLQLLHGAELIKNRTSEYVFTVHKNRERRFTGSFKKSL